MKVLKIEGTYFLVQNGELLDSFDDKESAELALFDQQRCKQTRWRNSRMKVLKIEGTYFLVQNGELLDSFDDKESAELALFDQTRSWDSYYDRERRRPE